MTQYNWYIFTFLYNIRRNYRYPNIGLDSAQYSYVTSTNVNTFSDSDYVFFTICIRRDLA